MTSHSLGVNYMRLAEGRRDETSRLHSPQDKRVRLGVEVAFVGQEVQPEEPVVAPALPHLKVRSKLPHDVLAGIPRPLVDHLDAVLVSEGHVMG